MLDTTPTIPHQKEILFNKNSPIFLSLCNSRVKIVSLSHIYTAVLAFPSPAQCSRTIAPNVVSGLHSWIAQVVALFPKKRTSR